MNAKVFGNGKTMEKQAQILICGMFIFSGLISMPAMAGDPVNGSKVFSTECSDCHSAKMGKNKKGPSVFALFGKPAGKVADAKYSDALLASNLTWTAENLDKYITHPRQFVVGGKMKYDGLADAAQRADVIAYLASLK